ncbi:MAG: Uma2 family endonuclease [Bacteroidia bacterium]|nr:Uma2 family endonuclease [Bacteroidia bacterium]
MTVQLPYRLLSVSEYHRMAEAGILSESERLELIEGRIIGMSPVSSEHAYCTDLLGALLHAAAGSNAIVRIQNPVRLSDRSEPEPDILLLRPPRSRYIRRHPAPGDVWLLIEISATSLDYDREVKLPLYAQAGIPEVWIIDLEGRQAEVFRAPADGQYSSCTRIGPEEQLEFPALGIAIGLQDLLP